MAHQGLKTVSYKTPHAGRRALLCLLLGAAILGVSWQAQKRLGVGLFSLTARHPSAAQDTARQSQELTLSAHTLYALQLGAFTQESAAEQLAQQFAARGAAGYVYRDADAYRVLAAAYPTRAEAQTVQTRLAAQSISTYIHPCVQEQLTLKAGGTGSQLNALKEALDYLDGLAGKLFTLSSGLDNGEVTAGQAREALLSEGVTCAALGGKLESAFREGLPLSLAPLRDTLRSVASAAGTLQNENGAARIGAALKKSQLTAFFGLYEFAASLQ